MMTEGKERKKRKRIIFTASYNLTIHNQVCEFELELPAMFLVLSRP